MAWISPTGGSGAAWNNIPNAYDEDTATCSYVHDQHDVWLELTHAAIQCNKIRVWIAIGSAACGTGASPQYMDIEVWYGDAWHNIKHGEVTHNNWTELPIGSTQSVTKARIAFYDGLVGNYDYGNIFEFDFWEVEVTAPTVTTQACTDVADNSATGNGNITATGGENALQRGFCYKIGTSGDPTIADSRAYDNGYFGTGAYTKAITGLTAGTGYRVRAYAINIAGTGYGATVQLTTTQPVPVADGDLIGIGIIRKS